MSELMSDQAHGGPGGATAASAAGATASAPGQVADGPDRSGGQPRGRLWGALTGRTLPPWLPTVVLAGVVALGIIVRFVSRSNLWLDEALSVNIADLGLSELLDALRQDGHPPLYYVLLHYWMSLVGEGDAAIRALSGIFAVASLPLAWIAGRRVAGISGARWTVALVALSPFWVRYATEARMYSLVMLLVLAGYLLLGDALERPTPLRLVGLAVVSGLGLLAHYWVFWLLGAVILLLGWRWLREPADRTTTVAVGASLAAGGLMFLPWLSSFLYQAEHTGTPWAGPMRPLAIVDVTLRDLGGGGNLNESLGYTFGVVLAALAALYVVRSDGPKVTLDLRTVPGARGELVVIGLTMAIGCVTAYAASSTFQARYAAVFVPLIYLVVAVGLVRLPAVARIVLGGSLLALSVIGVGWNLYFERTQSADVQPALAAHTEPGDVVVYCPDQLGPAYSRDTPDGLVELAYPSLASPERVDWVDYADRNAAADPQAIGAQVLAEAEGQNIFVVWRGDYETFDQQCEALLAVLSAERSTEVLISQDPGRYFEPANLYWLQP